MDRCTPKPSKPATDGCQTDIDPAVVRQALSGNALAQEELWRQVLVLVVKLARILCRGAQECEIDDVIQHSLLALIKRAGQLSGVRSWKAYLREVVTNSIIDIYRKKRPHEDLFSLEMPVNEGFDKTASLGSFLAGPSNVLEEVAARELKDRLERFLRTLPKEQAAVFRLHLQRISYKKIADQVGCPVGTVGTWINRIKNEIRQWLRNEQRPA